MPDRKFYELAGDPEGLVWLAQFANRDPKAFCKKDRIHLEIGDASDELYCPSCDTEMELKHSLNVMVDMARQKIFADEVKDLDIVRIDPDGYKVLAKERNEQNPNYWIETKLSDTSRGLQVMIQVGKRDASNKKVQLFVEPAAQRMDFDRSDQDIHPTGVFTEVVAKFKDSQIEIQEKAS